MGAQKLSEIGVFEKYGENATSQLIIQVVERQLLIGVHLSSSYFVLPADHMVNIIKSFKAFIGESACAAILFHVGKEVGRSYFEKLKAEHTVFSTLSAKSIKDLFRRYFTLNLIKDLDFSEESGTLKVSLKDFLGFSVQNIPLTAYYVKGFVQAFFECLLGFEPKVLDERFFGEEFFEMIFSLRRR